MGRDGNLLLNVGPRPDGQIEPDQVQRLHEIGDWLQHYGQSIYATRGGPYLPGDFGVSTFRDKTIYLHILKLPVTALTLPALAAKVLDCQCLTGGSATCRQTDQSLEITFTGNKTVVDTIVALTVESTVNAMQPIATQK